MNYSKVLTNPQFMPPPMRSASFSKKLENLYQIKYHPIAEVSIKKPFSNLAENKEPVPVEGIGHPPPGYKATNFSLTTTNRNEMNEIVFRKNKVSLEILLKNILKAGEYPFINWILQPL